MSQPRLTAARPEDAGEVLALTRAAFTTLGTLDPPSGVFRETVEQVAAELAAEGGVLAQEPTGDLVGVARLRREGPALWVRRVAVTPRWTGRGIGAQLLRAAEQVAADEGRTQLRLGVRTGLPENIAYWSRRGFRLDADHGFWVELVKPAPLRVPVGTAEAMRALGRRLASVLRGGDLVVLTGGLGAGKTTFVQGLGQGLGVRGPVTSPTFVLARAHAPLGDGPGLVHVDAYRLGSRLEVDDLDLDADLDRTVVVVEWGAGLVEGLADSRLEVCIERFEGPGVADESDAGARRVTVWPVGPRWGVDGLAGIVVGGDDR